MDHAVLYTTSIAKAHSYTIDLDSVSMPEDVCYHQWVGEFYPSFDLGEFIRSVWD